jgi:hypothetical protein
MALDSKNNIKSVFIIPDQTYTTVAKMYPGQDLGAVAVCDMSNNVFTTGANINGSNILVDGNGVPVSKIKLIKDRGDGLPLQQVVLTLPSVATYTGTAHVDASEQVSYIGNNGSTGTITGSLGPVTSNFFIIKLEHTPNSFIYGKRPASYKYGTYQSTGSDTDNTVAENLVKSLIQNFRANRTTDWRVRSEVVCNAATGSAVGFTSLTLTKYSKAVTVVGTLPSVGDVLRIADAGVTAVGATTAVYKVVAVNSTSNVITLNYAYQGPSGSTLAAYCKNITSLYAAASAGIKITGIKQKYDVNRWRQYDKVRFGVYLEGFGADTPTETSAALDGTGVYEQVANDEYISWGDEGQVFVDQVPPLFREQDAKDSIQYNPAVIGWVNKLPSLIGAGENKGQVILYFAGALSVPAGTFTVAAGNQTSFVTVFNAWRNASFPSAVTAWPKVV